MAKALKVCDMDSYPNIYLLLKILRTAAVTSWECERYGIVLKRLNTNFEYQRAKIVQEYGKVFPSKTSKKFFYDCNVSSMKLYVSAATSWKKWTEMFKYLKYWWYPFCTLLKLKGALVQI